MRANHNDVEVKYSVLFEKSPIPVILSKMPEAQVVEVNNAFLKLFGFTRAETIGKTSLQLGITKLADALTIRDLLLENGFIKDFECVRKNKNGENLFISLNADFLEIDGRKHVLTTLIDFTRQKQVEGELRLAQSQAQKSSQIKSEFLASMSHEIRTPLSIILGFSEMIAKSVQTLEQAQKYASRILQSTQHLKKLIDDVLDLSKIEAGKMVLVKFEFAFEKMFDEEMELLRHIAERKGLYLRVNKLRLPQTVYTDATRLRQILNNVVGNAIKYTVSGGVTIDVDYFQSDASISGSILEFKSHDTGLGISPQAQTQVFKAFEQGDRTKSHGAGGTGLGLVLAQKLAQSLGGDIRLQNSQENQGSTFNVSIDPGAAVGQILKEDTEMSFDEGRLSDFMGCKILSVEDNADLRLIVSKFLENAKIQVDFANDGEEGLSKALQNSYDLVLMDIQLPKMNGVEVTKTLRKQGYRTPIIAVTAHVLKSEHDRYLSSGFNDCLSKPFGTQSLLKIFQSYIKLS